MHTHKHALARQQPANASDNDDDASLSLFLQRRGREAIDTSVNEQRSHAVSLLRSGGRAYKHNYGRGPGRSLSEERALE